MKLNGEEFSISLKLEENKVILNEALSMSTTEAKEVCCVVLEQIKIQESAKQKNEETIKLDPEIVDKIKDGMKVTWKYEDEEKMQVSFDLSMDEEVSKLVKDIKKKEIENDK